MIRSRQAFWNRMLLIGDLSSALIAMFLAWTLRFNLSIFPNYGHVQFPAILLIFIIISTYLANVANGLYVPKRRDTLVSEFVKLMRSHLLIGVIFMSVLYAMRLSDFPRSVLLIYVLLSFVLTSAFRMAGRTALRTLRSAGFNQKHVLLVGPQGTVARVRDELMSHAWMGYEVDETIALDEHDQGGPELEARLTAALEKSLVDEAIIVAPGRNRDVVAKFIWACESHGVQASIVPDYFDFLPAKPRIHTFGEVPAIVARGEPLDDPFNALAKRLFDVVFSMVALIALSPIMLLTAIVIKTTSPGPVVFRQIRVGRGRRPFVIYKFRSMHTQEYLERQMGAERSPSVFAMGEVAASAEGWTVENDPRRTAFGAFLRRTSLDEVLQFWNVLKGDMSVIGPRPEQPSFVEQFQKTIPSYMVKHHVKPGITGWAQVNGWRGDTSIQERIRHDLYYIENWSFTMDLKIVWMTVFSGFVNKNAY